MTRVAAAVVACGAVALMQPAPAAGQQLAPPTGAVPPAVPQQPNNVVDLQGVHEYLDSSGEPLEISQLGITARDGHATLDDGESISGVSVVEVLPGSAAAKALGSHDVARYIVSGALIGAGVASAVLFPPALIGVVMLANTELSGPHDLVVGVDGTRVRNTMDFMESVADLQSGDTVYLSVVRHGERHQIPIHLP
jgi:S1-C subfamily serine protease